jgi:RHS repeat-associated protein
VVTSYAYDSASRLDVLSHDLSGTGSDLALDFAYNSAGQIVARDRTSNNGSYVYPQPAPNADAYVNNGLNQIASLDGAGLTYDARGNLTSAGGVSYAYDAFNRLTAAGPLSLAYDPAGRLYQTSAGETTTRFLYDGLQAIGEYNSSGVLQRRFVPGAGLDEHLVWYEGTGTSDRRWFVQDDLGSVVAVTNSSGANLSINAYDEYGAPAAGNTGLFGYTGQMYLSAAGLYHYRMRAYSPAMGRFLQTDPIGYSAGMNLYGYVDNDPMNWTDSLGLQRAIIRPPGETPPPPGVPGVIPPIVPGGEITVYAYDDTLWGNLASLLLRSVATGGARHNEDAGGAAGGRGGAVVEGDDIVVEGTRIRHPDFQMNPLWWVVEDDPRGGHDTNRRESNRERHEQGDARRGRDQGGERADERRPWPRRKPRGHRGPWPPPGSSSWLPFPFLFMPNWWSMCGLGDESACRIAYPYGPRQVRT